MGIVAIIPARGGSKSIPRKNIKLLCGKPLIAWTIEEAEKSKYLQRIIVSTEDDEIAAVARRYGAEVPFMRPPELAQDLSSTLEVVRHALDWFSNHNGGEPAAVVVLPPTSPLRRASDIDTGCKLLLESPEADSVRPVIESPKHPYKTLRLVGDYLEPFFSKEATGFDEPYDMARQLFPKAYVYSGALQAMWSRTIREQDSLTGKKSKYFFMRPEDSINIDQAIDFTLAEVLMIERMKQLDA